MQPQPVATPLRFHRCGPEHPTSVSTADLRLYQIERIDGWASGRILLETSPEDRNDAMTMRSAI
jgi:hypothetical protein